VKLVNYILQDTW